MSASTSTQSSPFIVIGRVIALITLSKITPPCFEIKNSIEQGQCGTEVTYLLDEEGLLTISGTGKLTSSPWTKTNVKNVVIEEGVTSIFNEAFQEYTNLVTVSISSTVTSFGKNAFMHNS